jgi:hypothetical protein
MHQNDRLKVFVPSKMILAPVHPRLEKLCSQFKPIGDGTIDGSVKIVRCVFIYIKWGKVVMY